MNDIDLEIDVNEFIEKRRSLTREQYFATFAYGKCTIATKMLDELGYIPNSESAATNDFGSAAFMEKITVENKEYVKIMTIAHLFLKCYYGDPCNFIIKIEGKHGEKIDTLSGEKIENYLEKKDIRLVVIKDG